MGKNNSQEEIKQEYTPGRYKKHIIDGNMFEIYKAEVKQLMDEFGMGDVWYVFQHSPSKETRASCVYTVDYRMVFMLSTMWYSCDVPTDESIKQVARHEVAHALNSQVNMLAQMRNMPEEAACNANEAYANRLERYITNKQKYITELEEKIKCLEKAII